MQRRRVRLLPILVLSVLLHVLLGVGFWLLPKEPATIALAPKTVTIVKVSKVIKPPPEIEQDTPEDPPEDTTTQPQTSQSNSASTENKIPRYQDLLDLPPPPGEGPGPNAPFGRKPYNGDQMGGLLAETSDLSANFDLPLVLRRQVPEGRAWAILKKEDNSIIIERLGGMRAVRAALFETLKHPDSYGRLENVFAYFKSDRVKIGVTYKTHFVTPGASEFKTQRKVYENEIEITTHRFVSAPKFGVDGMMVIDDIHAKRARQRDQRHWGRLLKSPAYTRRIENYRIEESTKRSPEEP